MEFFELKENGGYMGLLTLLITVLIITFLVWRTYGGADGKQKNVVQKDLQAIKAAQNIKDSLENRDRQIIKDNLQ